MKYLQIAFVLLMTTPMLAVAQDEPTPDLEQQVRDIAGLVVQNTDALGSLRDRVSAIETGDTSVLARLTDLEDRVFGKVVQTVVRKFVQLPSTYQPPPVPTVTPQFVFFCNLPQYVRDPYKRFIENKLREIYDFQGVTVIIHFRQK